MEVCYICHIRHDKVTGRGAPFCSRSWYPIDPESRPWGGYSVIESGHGSYLVKRIYVEPNKRFSLQYHNHRSEVWTIVRGSGLVELGTAPSRMEVKVGDTVEIAVGVLHRMTAGPDGVTFIEVQLGDILREDDIVRVEDDYGRVP